MMSTSSEFRCLMVFFFFKQKTAYELRISDWSSDVCSSDLKQHADYCPIQAYNHLDHNFPFAGKHIHQAAFPQLAANDRITRQATLTIFRPPLCFWIERSI